MTPLAAFGAAALLSMAGLAHSQDEAPTKDPATEETGEPIAPPDGKPAKPTPPARDGLSKPKPNGAGAPVVNPDQESGNTAVKDAAAAPPEEDEPPLAPTPGFYTFHPESEPIALHKLVELIRDSLHIPIMALDNSLVEDANAKVVINIPITVKEEQIMPFLRWLLESKGYTILQNEFGVYVVQQAGEVKTGFADGAFSPTVILPTGVIRPSEMLELINAQMGPQAQQARITANDELGVLIITGPQGVVSTISDFGKRVGNELLNLPVTKFEVVHIAAPTAYRRMAELLSSGGSSSGGAATPPATRGNQGNQGGNEAAQLRSIAGNSLAGVLSQLTVDPTGNALNFRGRVEDAALLRNLLAIVDVPNTLEARWYPAGPAAEAVAMEGRLQGLGEVTIFETGGSSLGGGSSAGGRNQQFDRGANQASGGSQSEYAGAGFTLYPEQGGFIYRGTDAQQDKVRELVDKLSELVQADVVTYEFHKLKYAKAEKVVEIMNNLVNNQLTTGNSGSPLLGRDQNRRNVRRTGDQPQTPTDANAAAANLGSGEIGEISASDSISILEDEDNNQVVVKAPKRLQPQFTRLIDRLDLRRAQVYIEAKIVAVQANEQFRLAVEQQWINANGSGGAFNTNFGLSTFPTGSNLNDVKNVNLGSLGVTAAVIKSDMVPVIVTALQQDVNTRIISSPQILVDDNAEDATVSSIDRIPTTTTSQTNSSTITSQGEDAEAGTKLTVKPQIAEDGSVKLDFEIELSSFTGSAAVAGQAPPSQENKINATSVTVPADSTIVVGGLTFEATQETVFKIPILGDLPLIGVAFRDQRKEQRKTTLYVFITPKALQNPTPIDMQTLIVEGPAKLVGITLGLPEPEMERIEIVGQASLPADLDTDGSMDPTLEGPTEGPEAAPAQDEPTTTPGSGG